MACACGCRKRGIGGHPLADGMGDGCQDSRRSRRRVGGSFHSRRPARGHARVKRTFARDPFSWVLLRGEVVFVEESAEPVAPAQPGERQGLRSRGWLFGWRRFRERRPLGEGAMRSVFVVVRRVLAQHGREVSAAEDQEPVEAFAAGASDPALGVRPRLWRAHRRFDHADTFGAEDLVERARELAVTVTDQNPRPTGTLVVELHQQVPRLLSHPASVGVGRDPGQVDAAARHFDEEQDVEPPEKQRVDGEEVAFEDARRLRP
jgi:hypothetical protein